MDKHAFNRFQVRRADYQRILVRGFFAVLVISSSVWATLFWYANQPRVAGFAVLLIWSAATFGSLLAIGIVYGETVGYGPAVLRIKPQIEIPYAASMWVNKRETPFDYYHALVMHAGLLLATIYFLVKAMMT